ncbi:MAG TPA: POTRA domain-containing protein [Myxococcales bacterium]|nr:POTRA domain-containing protein [Myxococcales bacterium]
MRSRFVASARALFVLPLLAACATPYEPFEGHPVLAAIRFEGNRSISSGELLNHIATAPTSGFLFFSRTARYYDADLFALDAKRIERWYNQKGFYEAKVKNIQELRDDEGRVTVVVTIDEGRRAIVRKMDFEGLEGLSRDEVSDLDDALPVHPGDGFDEDVYEKAKDVLVDQLKNRGFARAQVRGRVEVAPEAGTADIVFQVDPGQRYTFGEVKVTGNHRVPSDAITHATGIDRGDQYNPQAIALAQQHVYNLGVFSGVRVAAEPLTDEPVAAVRVNVREAPVRTLKLGLGGSAEQGRWELPRLRAEYTHRSLFGGLRRLELASTVGYAFVPNPFPGEYDPSHSGITTLTSAQVTNPNVFVPGLDWVVRGEFGREIQSGFSYDDVAARAGLLYRRGPHTVGLSLNFVRDFHVDLRGTDLSKLAQTNSQFVADCPRACTLTYPELRYSYDGRDNVIEPTQGFFGSVSLQQTLKPGSFSYFRINPDVRAYAPIGRYAVLALRAMYGGMFTDVGNGPFTQRFFFGGQNEQRGYGALQQSPKVGATPCKLNETAGCNVYYATEAVSIGGKAAALISAEVRIHTDFILNHLGVVPFVDASNVGSDPKRPLQGGLEVAPGLGLRYLTPFGPIRLDVAYLLKAKDVFATGGPATDPKTGAPITMVDTPVSVGCSGNAAGCIRVPRFNFHVTLGEAF